MTKGRVEAFSDGVFAVAITLLVLDLKVPDVGRGGLGHALVSGQMLGAYAAYVVSFLIIGIIWLNHHSLFLALAAVDRVTLMLNLFLLMSTTAIPFATSVLSRYLSAGGSNAHAAAFTYSLVMLVMALMFAAMWIWATSNDCHLLHEKLPPRAVLISRLRFTSGSVFYVLLLGLAFFSAPLTLAGQGVLAAYYAVEQIRTERSEQQQQHAAHA